MNEEKKVYIQEEIELAIDIASGDDGHMSKKVIEILEKLTEEEEAEEYDEEEEARAYEGGKEDYLYDNFVADELEGK
jgi:hypothetical protein